MGGKSLIPLYGMPRTWYDKGMDRDAAVTLVAAAMDRCYLPLDERNVGIRAAQLTIQKAGFSWYEIRLEAVKALQHGMAVPSFAHLRA